MTARSPLALASAVAIALVTATRLAAPAAEPGALADRLPVPIRIVEPRIADSLRGRCRPGAARLRVRIDQRGLVTSAEVIRRFPDTLCVDTTDARRIDAMAPQVMREWAFLPAVTAGMPQSMVVEMPLYVPADTLHVPWHGGTIIGRVVDAEKGEPLPITRIALDGSALTTRTDGRGWFRVDHLVRLQCAVIADRVGYLPDTVIADVAPGRVDTLRFRMRASRPVAADSGRVAK